MTWAQINFAKQYLAVGRAKTAGGEGRTIPLNSELFAVLTDYVEWYKQKFGALQPEWYVFPFGSPQPTDPSRHVTTLKTVWINVRANAGVKGRWHDNRHTLITRACRERRGRPDDHRHRRPRLEADAEALQPHSDGSKAQCA